MHVVRRPAESRFTLLGPLIEWRRGPDSTSFGIRPLFWVTRHSGEERLQGVALYPFAWWTSSRDELFLRFFGLVSYDHVSAPTPSSPWSRQFTIYPFVFFRQGPQAGTSLSVLPVYVNVTNFFGYERIRMVLFPLYLQLVEPLYERTWLPFPFFSRVGGRAGRGIRFWPVYGHTLRGLESETTFVGWPFYVRQVDHPGQDGQVVSRISWPLFSAVRGPKLESRTIGYLIVLPLYTHTVNRKDDTETYGFPWPLWVLQRRSTTGERLSLRLTPFYQDRRTDTMRSVFTLWPFYRHRTGLGDLSGYERTDLMLVLYRSQRESETDGERRTRVAFPLWASQSGPQGASAQALTFADGLFPKNDKIETLYAPLYRIYGSRSAGGKTSRDLLWSMWEWGDGKLRPPWYFSTQ